MKKKIKRFLPVFACFVLLSGLFAMPVSAASSGWANVDLPFNQWYTYYELDDPNIAAEYINSSGRYVYAYPNRFLFGDGAGDSRPITGVRYRINGQVFINDSFISLGESFDVILPLVFLDCDLSAGDTFTIDFNTLLFGLDRSVWTLNSVKVSVHQITDDKDKIFTKNLTFEDKKNNGNYHCIDNSLTGQSIGTSSFLSLSISANVTLVGTGSGAFSFTVPNGISLGYGNPNSPEAPKYNKPDDGGAVGDLEDLEGQFGDQSQEGMDSANDTFKGFGAALSEFTLGLQFVSVLMRTFIFKMPWLNALFTISLGLGLFGFIVGLAGYAIGAHDRKVVREHMRNEKRKIWREEAKNHYSKKG